MLDGYLAVGNKCAVDLAAWNLPVSPERALEILKHKGFRVVEVNLIQLARGCVGRSHYQRGALISQAPDVMDCSTLAKWLYGQAGIWLPRHSIDQAEMGNFVPLSQAQAGDLVFTKGVKPYFHNPSCQIGHVGMVTEQETVIHAANSKRGVAEDRLEDFVDENFRTIRRIMSPSMITLESPADRMVEWSGQIRNIIVQNLTQEDEAT